MLKKLFGFIKKKEQNENAEQIEDKVEQVEEGASDEAVPSDESIASESTFATDEILPSTSDIDASPLNKEDASMPVENLEISQDESESESIEQKNLEKSSEMPAPPLSETTETTETMTQNIETTETVEPSTPQQDDLSREENPPSLEDETISEETQRDTQEPQEVEEQEEELGFFAKLKKGLTKTTKNFSKKLDELFLGYSKIEDEIFDELEELLILGDLGYETAIGITEELRKRADEKKIEKVSDLEIELENIIEEILLSSAREESENEYPQIIVVVGVNGVGKTTSIGKIASQLKNEGKSVMLAAGDTFRAAAADQLEIWAGRADVPIVRSNEGADPSAVIFDAIKSAQAKKTDVLICDTAGRLHNKKNLMNELEKIFRIVNREYPEAKKEVFLVIDATTGQNAINQAKTFSEVANLTGIILTKLDGTAKGGVVIGLSKELQVPIRYVGVGEKINDLQKFNAREFARALFSKNE